MSIFVNDANASYNIGYTLKDNVGHIATPGSRLAKFVEGDSSNPIVINTGEIKEVKYRADGNYYGIPLAQADALVVTGASVSDWVCTDGRVATFKLSNPVDTISITVKAQMKVNTITVNEGLTINAAVPVDDRMVLTTTQMKTMVDNNQPNVYFAVNTDNKKFYLYDKNATASEETGKFSVLSGGGGSLQADLTAGYEVGGVSVGTVFTNGTTLEAVLRAILENTTTDIYVGHYNGDLSAFNALSAENLKDYAVAKTLTEFTENVQYSNEVFYLLIKKSKIQEISEVDMLSGHYSTYDGLTTVYEKNEIISATSPTWGSRHSDITLDGVTYAVRGIYWNNWNVDTGTGNVDNFTIKFGGTLSVAWGEITGTLSAQTDLYNALNTKQDKLPEVPSAEGNYILRAKRTSSGVEYEWVVDTYVSV